MGKLRRQAFLVKTNVKLYAHSFSFWAFAGVFIFVIPQPDHIRSTQKLHQKYRVSTKQKITTVSNFGLPPYIFIFTDIES
jgi:hypothetical protein